MKICCKYLVGFVLIRTRSLTFCLGFGVYRSDLISEQSAATGENSVHFAR
jgi:hypothetical protein